MCVLVFVRAYTNQVSAGLLKQISTTFGPPPICPYLPSHSFLAPFVHLATLLSPCSGGEDIRLLTFLSCGKTRRTRQYLPVHGTKRLETTSNNTEGVFPKMVQIQFPTQISNKMIE